MNRNKSKGPKPRKQRLQTISMKKMLLTFCVSILPGCLFAGAVPWYQALGGSNQFAVPAGKVLLVERFVWAAPPASISVTMYHPNQSGYGGGNGPITFNVSPSGNQYTFSPPLRIGEGGFITFTQSVIAMGLVIDASDVSASASPSSATIKNGATSSAMVDSRTTQTTRTIAQLSPDLPDWDLAGVSLSHSASNPRLSRIFSEQNALNKFVHTDVARKIAFPTSN
jgi:hypothetical protein